MAHIANKTDMSPTTTSDQKRVSRLSRQRFDEIYESYIVGCGFSESDEYYRIERPRYWRCLELFCQLDTPSPARILEIGGGQLAVLCKNLFGDDCTVADISQDYVAPLRKAGLDLTTFNLMDPDAGRSLNGKFDTVFLLEVIEHIPLPGYVVIERIKRLLKPGGILFLTTPNLFRVRNVARMFLGVEYLDRFRLPTPGQGLGHQLEYSAEHLIWQLEKADMEVVTLVHDSLGRRGHSLKAQLARALVTPLELRPKWRDALVAVARRKSVEPATTALAR